MADSPTMGGKIGDLPWWFWLVLVGVLAFALNSDFIFDVLFR